MSWAHLEEIKIGIESDAAMISSVEQLEEFRSFYLSSGKSDINVTFEKIRKIDSGGKVVYVDAVVGADLNHLLRFQPVNTGRTLVGHADSQFGPFIDVHVGDVLPLERDFSADNPVLGISHNRH